MGMPAEDSKAITDVKLGGDSIVINIDNKTPSNSFPEKYSSSLIVNPQPLKLEVETTTDWAIVAVGLAGILSSVIIARYTSAIQRNQIKSNIANLRQKWLEDLRQAAVDFVEITVFIINHLNDDKDYLSTKDGNIDFGRLLAANVKLNLMLDIKHENNLIVMKLSDELISLITSHAKPKRPISEIKEETSEKLESFQNLMRDILENAWSDIKRDLNSVDGSIISRMKR